MSNKKVKIVKEHGKYIATLFSELNGYIESEGFSSKNERNQWIKSHLKDLRDDEFLYEEGQQDSFFAITYDYSGIILK